MKDTRLGLFGVILVVCAGWLACKGDEAEPIASADAGAEGGSTTKKDSGSSGEGGNTDKDGSAPTGPEVAIKYGGCATFTACGGDPKGTWTYAEGGCIDKLAISQCPDLVVNSTDVKISGTITIGDKDLTRNIAGSVKASVTIPASCTSQAGGNCGLVQLGLTFQPPNGPGFEKATCKAGANAGDCDCDVEKSITDESSTTYTSADDTISTDDGRSYKYCVEGSKLTYRDKLEDLVDATLVLSK